MSQAAFTAVWEYRVRPEAAAEFRRTYGPEGEWVRLFRLAAGYVDTVLLQDRQRPDRYVTIDHWETEAAFLAFRHTFARQFGELDRRCERLTMDETPLGSFSPVRLEPAP